MASPKVILTIGFEEILLPDTNAAATVIKLLSKGLSVRDRSYTKQIELRKEPLKLEMKIVHPEIKFVDEEGAEVAEKASKPKRLVGPSFLLELNGGRS